MTSLSNFEVPNTQPLMELQVSRNVEREESAIRPNLNGRTVTVSSMESSSREENSNQFCSLKKVAIAGATLACLTMGSAITFGVCESTIVNHCGPVITKLALAVFVATPTVSIFGALCVCCYCYI